MFSLIDDLKTRGNLQTLVGGVSREELPNNEGGARSEVASFHVKENSVFAILSLLVSWAIIDFRQKPR